MLDKNSYVIEVADSKYQLHLHHKEISFKDICILPPSRNVVGRPGRHGSVHLGQNFLRILRGFRVLRVLKVLRVFRVLEVFYRRKLEKF